MATDPYPFRKYMTPDDEVATIIGDHEPFTIELVGTGHDGTGKHVFENLSQFDVDSRILLGRWKAIRK